MRSSRTKLRRFVYIVNEANGLFVDFNADTRWALRAVSDGECRLKLEYKEMQKILRMTCYNVTAVQNSRFETKI